MNETLTTVRGTVITDPATRRVGDSAVLSFRVASNARYQDRETGEWRSGGTLYLGAACWGRLAEKVSGRIAKGDAVLVQGRLVTNEYEKDGNRYRDLEMRVSAIGTDLSRMDVTVRRPARTEGEGGDSGTGEPGSTASGHAGDGPSDDDAPGAGIDGEDSTRRGGVLAGAGVGGADAPF